PGFPSGTGFVEQTLARLFHCILRANESMQLEILVRKNAPHSLTFRASGSHIVGHLWKFETRKEKTGGQTKGQVGRQQSQSLCPRGVRKKTTICFQVHAPS